MDKFRINIDCESLFLDKIDSISPILKFYPLFSDSLQALFFVIIFLS